MGRATSASGLQILSGCRPTAIPVTRSRIRRPFRQCIRNGARRLTILTKSATTAWWPPCRIYGYLQVRQDEGSPKFLNDYCPEEAPYGAGIGFLTDGTQMLSMYYPGNANSFERIFGEGYLRKTVKGHGYQVDQTIMAPFGDDPVMVSMVKESRYWAWIVNTI